MKANGYYSEIDPYVCEWLRNLIAAGHIGTGEVVAGDMRMVSFPPDLGARQFHAFAGIGVWSYALRLAGWPDDVPVWTGSCPCQPFSQAGRRKGINDERHLWPIWFKLIEQHHPSIIFGEQVASLDGLDWFDAVCADLENTNYEVGAADLCAAGIGAPHIRQRLYFVAVTHGQRREELCVQLRQRTTRSAMPKARGRGEAGLVGMSGCARSGRNPGTILRAQEEGACQRIEAGSVADFPEFTSATRGVWSGADWIGCRDGKWRPVEPGTFPLAHGAPARMGRLRAYGNTIVAPLAATFIESVMEAIRNVQD